MCSSSNKQLLNIILLFTSRSAEKEQAILVTIVKLTDIVDTEEPPGVDLCSKNSESVLLFKVIASRVQFS